MRQRLDYPRRLINDEMWELLEKHLEEIRDGRGTKPEQSQREFLEAVLYLIRTGDPWRDLPPQLGNWHSVYCRFRRWEKAGYWQQLWQQLSRPEVQKVCALFVDSTTVRSHQHAAGAPKKRLVTGSGTLSRRLEHQNPSGRLERERGLGRAVESRLGKRLRALPRRL